MSIHDGHRERLDKKVRDYGLEILEPHEQLEFLLFAVMPRGDTNELAHRLLKKYVTIAGVVNADPRELMKIEGVGPRCAKFLSTIPELLGIVERSVKFDLPPVLDSSEKIKSFVKTFFYGKLTEAAYVISLNSSCRLLSVSPVPKGAKGEIYIYPDQLVRLAILENASMVIVAHNHPGGSVNPSAADVKLSRELARAFDAVDIIFADSIIVSGTQVYSLREKGYLKGFERDF